MAASTNVRWAHPGAPTASARALVDRVTAGVLSSSTATAIADSRRNVTQNPKSAADRSALDRNSRIHGGAPWRPQRRPSPVTYPLDERLNLRASGKSLDDHVAMVASERTEIVRILLEVREQFAHLVTFELV